jgi:hypothetical protein
MNLETILTSMNKGLLTVHEIGDARNYLAAQYTRRCHKQGVLASQRATWTVANMEKYKSHAACERAWEATEAGQALIELEYANKGIQAVIEALTSNYYILNNEAKNLI